MAVSAGSSADLEPDDDADVPAWRTPLPMMYAEPGVADPDPSWDADADDAELRLF